MQIERSAEFRRFFNDQLHPLIVQLISQRNRFLSFFYLIIALSFLFFPVLWSLLSWIFLLFAFLYLYGVYKLDTFLKLYFNESFKREVLRKILLFTGKEFSYLPGQPIDHKILTSCPFFNKPNAEIYSSHWVRIKHDYGMFHSSAIRWKVKAATDFLHGDLIIQKRQHGFRGKIFATYKMSKNLSHQLAKNGFINSRIHSFHWEGIKVFAEETKDDLMMTETFLIKEWSSKWKELIQFFPEGFLFASDDSYSYYFAPTAEKRLYPLKQAKDFEKYENYLATVLLELD